MNKTQKILIVAATLLSILAISFPPHWTAEVDHIGKLVGKPYIKWELGSSLLDEIQSGRTRSFPSISIEKRALKEIQFLEIAIIWAIAAAAFLVAKKSASGGWRKERFNRQKAIILAAALLVIVALLYLPYEESILSPNGVGKAQGVNGWAWVIRATDGASHWFRMNHWDTAYRTIRYPVLMLEILGILILAGAALQFTRKR